MLSFGISPILSIPAAQAPPVVQKTNNVRKKAAKLYDDGLKSFRQEKFEEALGYFQASYVLIKNYNTLFNIGRCLVQLARLKEAIEIYKLYLKERLPHFDPKKDEAEIKKVKSEIAEFERIEAEIEKAVREAEAPKKTPTLTTPKPQPTKLEPKPQPSAVVKPSPPPPSYRKWGTWTAFVLSAASAAAGAASILKSHEQAQAHDNLVGEWKASGKINCEAGVCRAVDRADADKLHGLESDVDRYNRLGIIMLSTAAASLALGAGLLLLGKPQQKPKVSLSPTLGDQFGLGLSIQF